MCFGETNDSTPAAGKLFTETFLQGYKLLQNVMDFSLHNFLKNNLPPVLLVDPHYSLTEQNTLSPRVREIQNFLQAREKSGKFGHLTHVGEFCDVREFYHDIFRLKLLSYDKGYIYLNVCLANKLKIY